MPELDRLTLDIELGSAAVEDPIHVAQALRKLADKLEQEFGPCEGIVIDANGNTVGRWELS